jgi:hypothetical protein
LKHHIHFHLQSLALFDLFDELVLGVLDLFLGLFQHLLESSDLLAAFEHHAVDSGDGGERDLGGLCGHHCVVSLLDALGYSSVGASYVVGQMSAYENGGAGL